MLKAEGGNNHLQGGRRPVPLHNVFVIRFPRDMFCVCISIIHRVAMRFPWQFIHVQHVCVCVGGLACLNSSLYKSIMSATHLSASP